MLIENYDNVYSVIQHYYTSVHLDRYVCRSKKDQQLYDIIRIRDKKITEKILSFICEQKSNKKFSDLIDQFVFEGDLHVVFVHAEGLPLKRKLEQSCPLEERMEIGKKLIEQMILLEQPEYFQCMCLEPDNIIVTDAGDVRFRYSLEWVERYSTYTSKQAVAYLFRIFEMLFEEELSKKIIPPMEDYLWQLKNEEEMDDMKQFKLFSRTCEEILAIPKEEFEMPRTFLYHLWMTLRGFRTQFKKILLSLIFAGVFFYMVYNIYLSFQTKGYVTHFQSIGTMQIDEHEEKEKT